jgi:hypothetical protein
MTTFKRLTLATLFTLGACAPQSEAGDACETHDDCVDGLECHHHEAEGEEEHEDHEEEDGVCEEEE